jgi:hypothetical protein
MIPCPASHERAPPQSPVRCVLSLGRGGHAWVSGLLGRDRRSGQAAAEESQKNPDELRLPPHHWFPHIQDSLAAAADGARTTTKEDSDKPRAVAKLPRSELQTLYASHRPCPLWVKSRREAHPPASLLSANSGHCLDGQQSPGAGRREEKTAGASTELRLQRRLFRHSHEQSAGQVAVCTNHGCIMGVVVLAKKGRWPVIGLFLRQRFVGRTIAV